MNYMKRLVLALFLLMLMTAITFSQTPVKVDGPSGLSLLNSLTQSPPNQANESLNQTNASLNQTNASLNQTNGSLNATNQTVGMLGIKSSSSSDLWSWGSMPKDHSKVYNIAIGNSTNSASNSANSASNSANSASNSGNDPLAETSDLKDLNDLAEQNAFASD